MAPLTDHSVIDIAISIDLECERIACRGLFGPKPVGESGQRKGKGRRRGSPFSVRVRAGIARSGIQGNCRRLQSRAATLASTLCVDRTAGSGAGGRRGRWIAAAAAAAGCETAHPARLQQLYATVQAVYAFPPASVGCGCQRRLKLGTKTQVERNRRTTRRALPSWIVLMQVQSTPHNSSGVSLVQSRRQLRLEARARRSCCFPLTEALSLLPRQSGDRGPRFSRVAIGSRSSTAGASLAS